MWISSPRLVEASSEVMLSAVEPFCLRFFFKENYTITQELSCLLIHQISCICGLCTPDSSTGTSPANCVTPLPNPHRRHNTQSSHITTRAHKIRQPEPSAPDRDPPHPHPSHERRPDQRPQRLDQHHDRKHLRLAPVAPLPLPRWRHKRRLEQAHRKHRQRRAERVQQQRRDEEGHRRGERDGHGAQDGDGDAQLRVGQIRAVLRGGGPGSSCGAPLQRARDDDGQQREVHDGFAREQVAGRGEGPAVALGDVLHQQLGVGAGEGREEEACQEEGEVTWVAGKGCSHAAEAVGYGCHEGRVVLGFE